MRPYMCDIDIVLNCLTMDSELTYLKVVAQVLEVARGAEEAPGEDWADVLRNTVEVADEALRAL